MIVNILRSLATTLSVSGTCALVGWSLDYDFWRIFALITAIQFVSFWVFNSILQHIKQVKMTQLENERIAEYTKQSITAECAYCKTSNMIPLRVNNDNDFDCTNCNKPNAVYIGITVTQKTNPMNVDSLAINTLNPDERSAIEYLDRDGV